MSTILEIGALEVELLRKDIKHVHLSVYPPEGRVRVAAPRIMSEETVRVYVLSKLNWIRKQQQKFSEQEREPQREYIERESHEVWGCRLLLSVREADRAPAIELTPTRLIMHVRPRTDRSQREALLEEWYRNEVRRAAMPLIANWARVLDVAMPALHMQRMKTKWGSCNTVKWALRLNTELGKKPRPCLEYIVLHEMLHLIEPTHSRRFTTLLDTYMPQWREVRAHLNRLPVRYE